MFNKTICALRRHYFVLSNCSDRGIMEMDHSYHIRKWYVNMKLIQCLFLTTDSHYLKSFSSCIAFIMCFLRIRYFSPHLETVQYYLSVLGGCKQRRWWPALRVKIHFLNRLEWKAAWECRTLRMTNEEELKQSPRWILLASQLTQHLKCFFSVSDPNYAVWLAFFRELGQLPRGVMSCGAFAAIKESGLATLVLH